MREPADMHETQQDRDRMANMEPVREERERPADIQQAREERARIDANRDPNQRPLPGTTPTEPRMNESRVPESRATEPRTSEARMPEPRINEPRINEAREAHMTDESRQATMHRDDRTSEPTPLFGTDEADGFRHRWESVQADFVDDPRHAVEDADKLVSDAIQRLSKVFAEERTNLEQQWKRGDDVSTEDLRLALTKYRSFFERLLAA